MSEKFYISIPEPCHEDWNKMTAVEQGRFCSSCQKKVIDFTMQDDEAIISFFNNYNGSACGRFNEEQLDRPVEVIELKPASPFLKYAAGLLLPAFLFATKAKGQTKDMKPVIVNEPVKADISSMLSGKISCYTIKSENKVTIIKGRIVDAVTNDPLPGTSVSIKGTDQGVVADEKGDFMIYVPAKNATLLFSSIGYELNELKCDKAINNKNLVVKMGTAVKSELKELVVTGYKTITCRALMGGVSISQTCTYTIWDKVKDTLTPASTKIKIYPNPVAASGTIQLLFPDVKPGTYQLRLLGATGQLFYSFQKQVSGKGETEQIHLSGNTAPGIYIVQVLDEKKKLVQSTKISIQ